MRRNEIKNSLDLIQPDPHMKTRIKAKISEAKPKKTGAKLAAAVSAALCLVLLLSVFAVSAPHYKVAQPEQTTLAADALSRMPGEIMIAYADENGSITEKPLNESYTLAHLYIKDIRGMSAEEIKQAYYKACEECDTTIMLPIFPHNTVDYDEENNIPYKEMIKNGDNVIFNMSWIGDADDTSYPLQLNLSEEDIASLESITVSHKSDYLRLYRPRLYAVPAGFDERELGGPNDDGEPFFVDNFTVSGDFIRKEQQYGEYIEACYREEYGEEGYPEYLKQYATYREERLGELDIDFTLKFYQTVSEQPDFDLSEANDEITFQLTFKDGSTVTNVIGVTFEQKEGNWVDCVLTPISYERG